MGRFLLNMPLESSSPVTLTVNWARIRGPRRVSSIFFVPLVYYPCFEWLKTIASDLLEFAFDLLHFSGEF
jgi:hypothetical protein